MISGVGCIYYFNLFHSGLWTVGSKADAVTVGLSVGELESIQRVLCWTCAVEQTLMTMTAWLELQSS